MTEWLPVFKDLGFPLAFVLLVAWKVWPFIVDQVNRAQAERRELSAEFLKSLERRDAGFAEIVGKLKDVETAINRRLDR